MLIENNRIIRATEDELYDIWLKNNWDDIYSFSEYVYRMKVCGCTIISGDVNNVKDI